MFAPTAFASAIDPLAPSITADPKELAASGAFARPGIITLPSLFGA